MTVDFTVAVYSGPCPRRRCGLFLMVNDKLGNTLEATSTRLDLTSLPCPLLSSASSVSG